MLELLTPLVSALVRPLANLHTERPSSSQIKDPKHQRHAELSEWIGDDFDPNAFNAYER